MNCFNTLLNFLSMHQIVCIFPCLCKHNRLSLFTMNKKDISQCLHFVLPWAGYAQMLNVFLCLIFLVFSEVNHLIVGTKVGLCYILDPWRNGSGKKEKLRLLPLSLLNGVENGINVFFKAHIKHLICFIKNESL